MKNYLRNDLIDLVPYDEGDRTRIYKYKLDANESPWDIPERVKKALAKEIMSGGNFNRYPDSNCTLLRKYIGQYCNVFPEQVVVGSGSDEIIQILVTAFVNKGDYVICPTPSFGMYRIFTSISGGKSVEIPLAKNFQYDTENINSAINKHKPKLVFLCSPNNPTGNVIEVNQVLEITKNFDGIVVVDEAYGEFTQGTMISLLDECPNLVVLKTFSKALGLAGLRIGYCICAPELAKQISKVKPPYNVNSFSQKAAIMTLENQDIVKERISEILRQREFLYQTLKQIPGIDVYPSEANFLLIRVPNGTMTWKKLMDKGILVRNFSHNPHLENCLRVTVGDQMANQCFIDAMKEIMG
ncbi:MAG: histidinol-phosphate transaminase [Caldicoprobacterales bacterium]|nr:histidinol-phosphate transaminase [Clostridiales bacterium]